MGAARDIGVFRVTAPPGQNMDGVSGRSAGWIVGSGTYRTRTSNNGAGVAQGSYFNAGETWWGCVPIKVIGTAHYPGRTHNFHDEAVSGFSWGSVSPLALDVYLPGSTSFDTGNPAESTVEYTSACAGAGGSTHWNIPWVVDDWMFLFYKVLWKIDCTGSLTIWRQRLSAPSLADGPVVNLTNIKTLNPDPTFFPGVQMWQGCYVSSGFTSGASIVVDHMLSMWGRTPQQMWDDSPFFVEFQENSPTGKDAICIANGVLNTSDFPIPNDIAAQLADPPGGGGGSGATGGNVNPPLFSVFFGKTWPGNQPPVGGLTSDARRGSAAKASSPMTATTIAALMSGTTTNVDSCQVRAIVYAMSGDPASGGLPTVKIGESAPQTLAGDLARQWVLFPLLASFDLAAGSWIVIEFQTGGANCLALDMDSGNGFFFFKSGDLFADGADAVHGTPDLADGRNVASFLGGVSRGALTRVAGGPRLAGAIRTPGPSPRNGTGGFV